MQYAADEAEGDEAHGDDEKGKPVGSTSIPAILLRLGVEIPKQDQAAANRVARCLKAGGWERFRKREGNDLKWRYRRKTRV